MSPLQKKITQVLALGFLTLSPLQQSLSASPSSTHHVCDKKVREMMVDQLNTMKSIFEVKYAPFLWKSKWADWNLDEQIELAKSRVIKTEQLTIKEYQKIVRDFFNSVQDEHVGVHFYSTEMAHLPFKVKSVGDRYFVAYVADYWVDGFSIPMEVGDEVLFFGGKKIGQAVEEVKKELHPGSGLTTQALAEGFLTLRDGSMGATIPSGEIKIVLRDGETGKRKSFVTDWYYSEEQIQNHATFPSSEEEVSFDWGLETKSSPENPRALFKKWNEDRKYQWNLYDRFNGRKGEELFAESPFEIGARKSFVPDLGEKIEETDEEHPFHAYKFYGDDGKVYGYIRISAYSREGEEEQAQEAFEELIKDYEETTEALVIDQVNNPGGYLHYLNSLLSHLAKEPLRVPYEREKVTQEDAMRAILTSNMIDFLLDLLEDGIDPFGLEGDEEEIHFIKEWRDHLGFILNEWNEGRILTDKYRWFIGKDYIHPHPTVRYSKPILVLINEQDFSCGDLFPAILQDDARATLFGTRTAGAGGRVGSASLPNFFGVAGFTYTYTIAERMNGNPIENLGVDPDIKYSITEHDIKDNYSGYREAVLKALKEL